MGFIAKRLIKYNYDLVDVLVEDTLNEYFNVVELPVTLTQGRSAFKIFGSDLLKVGVPLKMELLDSVGNTVYVTPVDLVGEEVPPFLPYRFVTIEVYRPPVNIEGLAKLTILGEIEPSAVNFEIPPEFQNTYNIKYSSTVNIDLSTNINTQPIRFYKNPTIEAEEKVRPRIVETPITTTVKVFASSSAEIRSDIKDVVIPVVTGSQEKPDGIPQAPKNKLAADVLFFKEDFKFKSGFSANFPPILARRGKRNFFASPEPEAFTLSMADGGLKSNMQGATITIPKHTQILENLDENGNPSNTEVTVPEFTTKVLKVIDEKKFVPDDIPFILDPSSNQQTSSINESDISGDGGDVIVPDLKDVPISMSFEEYEETVISSSIHFDSFMELKVKNMRTFSGDVYRLKVHGAMNSQNSGFSVMGDSIVESPELLVDKSSQSGFLRTGYFYTQSIVDSYWTGSSYEGNTRGDSISFLHTGSQYIDSLRLSGSNYGVDQTLVAEQKLGYEFIVGRSIPYTLTATVAGIKTDKVTKSGVVNREGRLYFHLTGSHLNTSKQLPTNADVGGELTDVDSNRVVVLKLNEDIEGFQKLGTVEFTFLPRLNLDRLSNTDTKLQLRADSGRWHISDLSLRPAQDSGFSPDEYGITIPLPRSTRPDKLNTFIEFFDINSNVAEEIAAKKDIEVLGSALVIDGDDNLLTGSLFMGNVAGAGIEMAGANSAFMRSVGYKGFISASEQGHGGFMIFSGSVLPDESDSYEGAGLEIHDGTTGEDESYFKFRTKPSIFDVKTKTFFLGSRSTGTGGGSSNFISGSQGNLEISSSGFVVTADGNVTASNFQFISGVVSEDVTIEGTVSANSLLLPVLGGITTTAANASASIETTGNARFRSGSIGGFSIGTNSITATNFELNPSDKFISLGSGTDIFVVDGDVGLQLGHGTFASAPFSVTKAGVLKATSGTIGGWTLSANDITSNGLLINSSGRIESANYASNQFGFRIDALNNGEAEFENVRIRGTLKTTVFEKETVNAVGGQLYVANSSTITGSDFFGTYVPSASATTATMSIANVSGFTGSYGTTGTSAGEILSIKKVTSTGFSTEYVQVHSASRVDAGSDIDLRGHIYVTRAYNQGVAGESGSLGDLASTAASYAEGQVIVSTGRVGTGFIRLNANPNDFTTPYIDIVERTGSGVYDTALKVRLGDMSGLSKTRLQGTDPAAAGFGLYSENVFLEGGIIANTGSIAGIKMQNNKLFIGTGTHGNSNTAFFVDNSGQFSLKDKLVWDGTNLSVNGSITISNPSDIDISAINNDSGFTDDTIATAAQLTATGLGAASASLQTASASLATRARITGTGLDLVQSDGTVRASYAATTTIGNTSNEHVSITATELRLKDGGTTRILLNSSGITMGNHVSIDSSGDASFSGNLSAAGGTFSGNLSAAGGTFSGDLSAVGGSFTGTINVGNALGNHTASLATASASLATRARISSTGLELIDTGGTLVSSFGTTVQVGVDSATESALRIDSSGNMTIGTSTQPRFTADANGNVTMTGKLFVGGSDPTLGDLPQPTRPGVNITTTSATDVDNSWGTGGAFGVITQPRTNMIRHTAASGLGSGAGATRIYYRLDEGAMNQGHRFRVSGEVSQSAAINLFLSTGRVDLSATSPRVEAQIASAVGLNTPFTHDFVPGNVNTAGNDVLFFFTNGGASVGNHFIDIVNLQVVDMDATGSNESVSAVIGGFKFDGDSMYSGRKTGSGAYTQNGSLTVGGEGFISAPSFSISAAGNAKFKGQIELEALVEQSDGDFIPFSGGVGSFIDEIGETIGGGAACVLRETTIVTKRGEINIEDTKGDDIIKVYDWSKKEWGWSPIDKILNRITKVGWSHIKTKGGYELKCSNSHLLYHPMYPGNAIKTDELGVGGQLYVVENDEIIEDYIESIKVYNESIEVWNYELEYTHNYISNGILSHNALPKDGSFTGKHKYFVTGSTDITPGDAVKLDSDNFLVRTTSAKDTTCIGIATKTSKEFQTEFTLDIGAPSSIFETDAAISRSLQLDSFGTISNEEDYDIMVVASLGDNRDFHGYLSGSESLTLTTSSFQTVTGFKICNQGGLVSKGDLLCTSDTAGYLMKQPVEYSVTAVDDGTPTYEVRQNINSFTVGKTMESCSFDSNGKVEGVYGYLYCG